MAGSPGGSVVKTLPANKGDAVFIPGSESCPGEGNSNPLLYSCLKNPTDRRSLAQLRLGLDTTQQLNNKKSNSYNCCLQPLPRHTLLPVLTNLTGRHIKGFFHSPAPNHLTWYNSDTNSNLCLIFLHISFLEAFTKCPINLT